LDELVLWRPFILEKEGHDGSVVKYVNVLGSLGLELIVEFQLVLFMLRQLQHIISIATVVDPTF